MISPIIGSFGPKNHIEQYNQRNNHICDDCKQKLYYSTTNYFEKRQDFFICSTHRANKDKCSGHYIRAVVLEQQVWKHIQEVISVVTRYEAYFRSEMEEKLRVQSEETLRIHKKRLAQAEKRIGELDRLFIRSYEDNVSGKIDDERFAMINKSHTQEQKDLKAEVISLQQVIEEQERQAENLEQFIQRVKRNSELTELRSQRACEGGLCRSTRQVQRQEETEDSSLLRPHRLYSRGCTDKSRTGMTEIMPVPRKLRITVLPAESVAPVFLFWHYCLLRTDLAADYQVRGPRKNDGHPSFLGLQ